MFLTWAQDKNI